MDWLLSDYNTIQMNSLIDKFYRRMLLNNTHISDEVEGGGGQGRQTYQRLECLDLALVELKVRSARQLSRTGPAAAGNYLIHHNANRQTIEDITVAMIVGSVEAIKRKYDTSSTRQ